MHVADEVIRTCCLYRQVHTSIISCYAYMFAAQIWMFCIHVYEMDALLFY
jgi:hypothetical protein